MAGHTRARPWTLTLMNPYVLLNSTFKSYLHSHQHLSQGRDTGRTSAASKPKSAA